MKKYIHSLAAALLLIAFAQNVFAQDGVEKGNFLLSPGIGFGYVYAGGVTLGINGEYAFTDEISGGGYLAFTRWDYGWTGSNISYNFFDFGARASYHFAKLLKVPNRKFDPYAGAQLGFNTSTYNYDGTGYPDAYDGGVRGGLYAGARWFFNEKVGAFGEVGFALCPIMLGATFKF